MDTPLAAQLDGVHGSGANDVWAVGWSGTILHRVDGGVWQQMPGIATDLHFHAVWAVNPSNAWVVGERADGAGGAILHWDGVSWTDVYGATAGPGGAGPLQFDDVWARTDGTVFAVGHENSTPGVCYQYDGTDWKWQNDWPVTSGYYGIRGDEKVLYVAAQATDMTGEMLLGTAEGWTTSHPPDSTALFDVWPNASNDVHVCSYNGKIFHYDGSAWVNTYSGTTGALRALWGSPDGDMYAAGANGTILHLAVPNVVPVPGAFLLTLVGASFVVRARRRL